MTSTEIILMLVKAIQNILQASNDYDRQQIAVKAIEKAQTFLFK